MKRSKRAAMAVIALGIGLFFLEGCGRNTKPFVKTGVSIPNGARLAILPFDDLSGQESAGRKFDQLIYVELLRLEHFAIAPVGDVEEAMTAERVRNVQSISREQMTNLAAKLQVDYLVIGTVLEYDSLTVSGVSAGTQVPVIAAGVRLIDAASGEALWAKNRAVRGDDKESLFQIGRVTSLNKLAQFLAEDFAKSLKNSLLKRLAG